MLKSYAKSFSIFLFTVSLLASFAFSGSRTCRAFEIQKIPLPQKGEGLVEEFKALSPEQQQKILKKYREDVPEGETKPKEIEPERGKVLEKEADEKEKDALEAKDLKEREYEEESIEAKLSEVSDHLEKMDRNALMQFIKAKRLEIKIEPYWNEADIRKAVLEAIERKETAESARREAFAEKPVEELSRFEEFVAGKLPADISKNVRQFGYNLFIKPPSTFAPPQAAPVTSSYVIGPDDEIKISLWGKVEKDITTTVDRDGSITLPSVGVVHVAGLTFQELKGFLKREFDRYFPGFNINVTLGKLRSIKIFVVGHARYPGSYNISGLSTLINALFATGGLSKTGSMRNIKILRNGKEITQLDMYDFIMKGDKSKDVNLEPGDVIFIPPVGELVAVVGNVRTPAIYELKGATRMLDALSMAGDVSVTGYLKRVQVERIEKNEFKIVVDMDLSAIKDENNIVLRDGDIIKVFPISTAIANAVILSGNVVRPGDYEWHQGMRVSDLFPEGTVDLLPDTLFEFARIDRRQIPYFEREAIYFNLDKALKQDPAEDKILEPSDTVTIFNRWTYKDAPVARIEGAVNKPGVYVLTKGLRLLDLVKLGGHVREDASFEFGRIERTFPEAAEKKFLYFSLQKLLEEDENENIAVEVFDVITIFSKWDFKEKTSVRITGAVQNPGEYEYREDMKLSDLVLLTNGIRRYACNEAELTRVHITQSGPVTERWALDISRMPDGSLKDDPILRPDDYVFVKTIPDWFLYHQITVRGEVRFPGTYPVKKGERLADLLERAGGFTENAYLKGSVFMRKSVQETQQKMLEQAIDRLEQEVLSAAAAKTATAFTEEESKILEAQTRQYQELIKRLRSVRAIGRLVISMAPLNVLRQTPANVELEDGDEIFIPSKVSTINVMGSVYNPSTYLYDPETKFGSYIEMAGGPSENADTGKTYVIKVDGSALSHKKIKGSLFEWNTKTYRWEVSSLSKTKLDPGDTIIVPEKFDRLALMRNIKDISQIIFQMAVTAGVVVALFP